MSYRPQRLGSLASERVAAFIRDPVEWTLQDVPSMLRLPIPELDVTASCNFAIANALLVQICGLNHVPQADRVGSILAPRLVSRVR
jgi:hypothetical protein